MSSAPDEVIEAIREFLRVIDDPESSAEARIVRLQASLDRLAWLQHQVSYPMEKEYRGSAPAQNYKDLRDTIAARFPRLGSYHLPAPVKKIGGSEIAIADAIDDITDIASELHAVLWYSENTSLADAMWHFQTGYQRHWGEHLRGLQLHLHHVTRALRAQDRRPGR